MPLTASQEAVIAATAPVVAEHLPTITRRFYPILFDRYPEVRPLFNEAHQANGAQPQALAGSVLAYVQLRQDPVKARKVLETVVSKHVSLDIRPEQYPLVGECLMVAIGEVLGDAVTPEVADAWGALYGELADLLIELEEAAYQTFEHQPGGWRGPRAFVVSDIRDESSVIRSFELTPSDQGAVAPFRPGQFIGVKVMINGVPHYRHYSLSAYPNGRSYRLSIKREPDGKVSQHFHEHLQPGDQIELLPPAGNLTLATGTEPVMLLSGGVGQTPLLPIAREALEAGRRVVYIHAALDPAHHAFGAELQELADRYPDLLQPVIVYEQTDDQHQPDHVGRLNTQLLQQYLPDADARCYFVGPRGFMVAVEQALETLGIPADRRHSETFGPSATFVPA